MKIGSAFAIAAALLPSVTALPSRILSRDALSASWSTQGPAKALYFLENDSKGAKLAALSVGYYNGYMQDTFKEYSTQGLGSSQLNATSQAPLTLDSLQNQGTVAVGDNYVFTVNPGSNTMVMFAINPLDPTELTMVGKPVSTIGEFPLSVTYSSPLKQACAINGGAVNGVACFRVSPTGLIPDGQGLRGFKATQFTPPQGYPETPSQVTFSPSSRYLMATVKGNLDTKQIGSILIWPIKFGVVSTTPVTSQISDIYVDWAFTFLGSDSRAFLTDGASGGSIIGINPSTYAVTQVSNVVSPKILASCWSEWSPMLNTAYAMDGATNNIMAIDLTTNEQRGFVTFDESLNGAYDTVVDGAMAYIVTGTPNIILVNLAGQRYGAEAATWQTYNLTTKATSDRKVWVGLAMYPNPASFLATTGYASSSSS